MCYTQDLIFLHNFFFVQDVSSQVFPANYTKNRGPLPAMSSTKVGRYFVEVNLDQFHCNSTRYLN